MHRRMILSSAVATLALPAVGGAARAQSGERGGAGDLDAAIRQFLALPGTKSYLVRSSGSSAPLRLEHEPDLFLFVGSAFKTFVLAQYLRDIETRFRSEDEWVAIDDGIRSPGSPVFMELTGRTLGRSVLEAMIAHSDNTATDAAMQKVVADRVRELVAEAKLRNTRIPTSTRRFFSYLVGAPEGVDLGWPGIDKALENPPGSLRPPLNDAETLASTASDMVSWYEQALLGTFFTKPESLTEFRRIQAMADAIPWIVPPHTPAYAKGGSIEFNGFNCMSVPGQMVVGGRQPVTFCFTVNWNEADGSFPEISGRFIGAVNGILGSVARSMA